MKNKKILKKEKRPLAISLLIIWMGYMVLRGFLKIFDLEKLETNKQLLGNVFALANYWIDIAVLALFVVLIISFIKRTPKTWKYFIYLTSFLMLGTIAGAVYGLINLDKITSSQPAEIPAIVYVIGSVLSTFLLLAFYSLTIYLVHKHRGYFKNE